MKSLKCCENILQYIQNLKALYDVTNMAHFYNNYTRLCQLSSFVNIILSDTILCTLTSGKMNCSLFEALDFYKCFPILYQRSVNKL